jgi:hypothetical protein
MVRWVRIDPERHAERTQRRSCRIRLRHSLSATERRECHGRMRLRQKPTGETAKIVSARKETPAGLEHWPDDIWSDYPFAYVRLTTLRVAREIHLLFGCVEMLPREIQPLPDYYAPRLKLRRGATATSSLTVLTLEAALRWYEDSRSGVLAIPGTDGPARVRTACLAPEPRLGNLVVARTPTVPVSWHSGPRMHRMVPMDALPEAVTGRLAPTPDGSALHAWLIEHCFIDLVANPDCAGGLVLLAANPIVRGVSEYPLRKLPDGREVLGVKLVPRSGSSLDTIRVRLSELRPDGHSLMQEVSLDPFGEAEVILPQEAQDTALEVSCTRRGLLSAPPHTGFLRSVGFEIRPVRATMSVEVPARSKRQDDDAVWLFGNSFRSLGDGTVSMASKVRDASILLPMLVNASTEAESFVEFWGRTKPKGGAT